ncbi:calcium-binding protein [Streptomyces chromofuscus]|uniref:calcium-binding protein n=1 Tax=Streptomyces chromofuscus TaxID=42881 RepID=UPI001671B7A7|nr:calcium-binding protein [Streptomyces chromofuscus]
MITEGGDAANITAPSAIAEGGCRFLTGSMNKRAAATLVASLTTTGLCASTATAETRLGDTYIQSASVNGGKALVIGAAAQASFTATVTASDPQGIDYIDAWLYRGPSTAPTGALAAATKPTCTAVDATTTRCPFGFVMGEGWLHNADAGTWRLMVNATALDGDRHVKAAASINIQRASKLAVNAAHEPVIKGKPLTITGALNRISWNDSHYYRYANQPVSLQFRTPSGTYSTVKTVTADSTGYLRTTITATRDGYWRYSYAGNTTTAASNAPGDYVDVR